MMTESPLPPSSSLPPSSPPSASATSARPAPAEPPVVTAPRSLVRSVPGTAVGVLTAVAVGAVVWVPGPTAAPAAADRVTSRAVAAPGAAGVPLAHPVQPEAATEPAQPAQPALPRARDPFRPLLTPPDAATSTPVDPPAVSDPQTVEQPPLQEPLPSSPEPVDAPGVGSPGVGAPSAGAPSAGAPVVATGTELELTGVAATGDSFVATVAIDGTPVRAAVGDSFGPGGRLLLLSLQQGPGASQWTAVVQLGQGEPFDLVTGTSTRIP